MSENATARVLGAFGAKFRAAPRTEILTLPTADPHHREVAGRTATSDPRLVSNSDRVVPSPNPSEPSEVRPGRVPRLADDVVLSLRSRVRAGESIAALAREVGRSETAVRRAVRGTRTCKGVADASGNDLTVAARPWGKASLRRTP